MPALVGRRIRQTRQFQGVNCREDAASHRAPRLWLLVWPGPPPGTSPNRRAGMAAHLHTKLLRAGTFHLAHRRNNRAAFATNAAITR